MSPQENKTTKEEHTFSAWALRKSRKDCDLLVRSSYFLVFRNRLIFLVEPKPSLLWCAVYVNT